MKDDEKRLLVAIAKMDPEYHIKDLLAGIAKKFMVPAAYTARLCETLRTKGYLAFSSKKGYALTREGWKQYKELQGGRQTETRDADKRIIV